MLGKFLNKVFGYKDDRISRYYYQRQLQHKLRLAMLILVLLLSILYVVMTYFFFPVRVKESSMIPFANKGSILLFDRVALGIKKPFQHASPDAFLYHHMPERGDVVALMNPTSTRGTLARQVFDFPVYLLTLGLVRMNVRDHIVRRVLALPGESIRIENKTIYINDRIFVPDWNIKFKDVRVLPYRVSPRDIFKEVVIPGGYIFVLSDYWDVFSDSRIFGLVPIYLLEGTYARHLKTVPLSDSGS